MFIFSNRRYLEICHVGDVTRWRCHTTLCCYTILALSRKNIDFQRFIHAVAFRMNDPELGWVHITCVMRFSRMVSSVPLPEVKLCHSVC